LGENNPFPHTIVQKIPTNSKDQNQCSS